MPLSKRLENILRLFNSHDNVGDIGSDHGYLIISLAKKFQNNSFFACENKKGPFLNLTQNIQKNGLKNKIISSLSSGLDELPPYINTVSICGMGGGTIISILKKNLHKLSEIDSFVLSSHSEIDILYKFMLDMNYIVELETSFKDKNIFYFAARFKKMDSKIQKDASIYLFKDYFLFNNIEKDYKNKIKKEVSIYENYLNNVKEIKLKESYIKNRYILEK